MNWSGFFYPCEGCNEAMFQASELGRGWCDTCYVAKLESPFTIIGELPFGTAGRLGRVTAAYRYTGMCRELLRRAKLHHDWSALWRLRKLALAAFNNVWSEASESMAYCLPVASSLRGRSLGRLDVAEFLARDLARACQARFKSPPLREYWYWNRRSLTRKRVWPAIVEPSITNRYQCTDKRYRGADILIVDDIATSGYSLARTAQAVDPEGLATIHFFALAAGRSMMRASTSNTDSSAIKTPMAAQVCPSI